MTEKLIYIIAGEASGDILGSRLMRALRVRMPQVRFAGMGGETMAQEGLQSLFDISEISVMGVAEVIPRLRQIMRRVREVTDDITRLQPDVLVTIDSWGFVQQVLEKLDKRGSKIPRVQYVAPQVWAWKKGRAKKVAQLTDSLMTLLPMEPPYFEKYGLKSTFVGHPVIENTAGLVADPAAFSARYGIPEGATIISVLPGSRRSEIKRLAPIFKSVLQKVKESYPDLFLVIPTVGPVASLADSYFADAGIPYRIITGQYERYDAFISSRFAVAASGTVSLELTACGTPHIIAYRFDRALNFMLKRFAGTRMANLINILAGRFIIPEFVLDRCRADLIAPAVLELIGEEEATEKMIIQAREILQQLKPEGTMPSDKAASVVMEAMK